MVLILADEEFVKGQHGNWYIMVFKTRKNCNSLFRVGVVINKVVNQGSDCLVSLSNSVKTDILQYANGLSLSTIISLELFALVSGKALHTVLALSFPLHGAQLFYLQYCCRKKW